MFDRQLTDKRVAESVMRTLGLEVSLEEPLLDADGQEVVEFTIFNLDPLSGKEFVFGKAPASEVWTTVRELVEKYEVGEV